MGWPRAVILKKRTKVRRQLGRLLFRTYVLRLAKEKNGLEKISLFFSNQVRTLRSYRHLFHLPVNGQRSKTNANTQRKKGKFVKPKFGKRIKK